VVVNRDVITQSQLNKEIERATAQAEHAHEALPPAGELRKAILDSLITRSLQLQLIKTRGTKVTQEDVDKAINSIASSNKMTLEQLKQALQQSGTKFEDYKKRIAEQIAMQKLQQEEVVRTVVVTPEEAKKFAREYKNKGSQYSAFHVIDVVLSIPENSTATQVASLKKQAADLAQQLQKGKSIEALVKEQPGLQNNDLGWRSISEFPSIFQQQVATLRLKSISSPIAAPNGLHILYLAEARGDSATKPLTEADLKNMAFQYKAKDAVREWGEKLRKEAFISYMK
jgi:peptidyl-prolyl cis-trans isomerase SurA